jgi:hypothetical protein
VLHAPALYVSKNDDDDDDNMPYHA